MAEVLQQAQSRAKPQAMPGDYVQDGLLFCGVCHTAKECRISLLGQQRVVGCLCACGQAIAARQREQRRRQSAQWRAQRLRAAGIQDAALASCRFEGAGQTKLISQCRQYAANWPRMYQENVGLLLHGAPGAGKTFAAACVANALIDQGVPVLMTSLPRILNGGFDKGELLSRLRQMPLLVIDDLGVERASDYGQEITYLVIDERYKAKKPLIITTNLSLKQLQNPDKVACARIYERVLEMCVPLHAPAGAQRRENAHKKLELARQLFSRKEDG